MALAVSAMGACAVAPAAVAADHSGGRSFQTPLKVKVLGRLPDGQPRFSAGSPTGLSPSAVAGVYRLSGLSAGSSDGSGQIIAIVDAYHDPNALSDLNRFNSQYGYPTLSRCSSLSQAGACFEQADPQGTPSVNSGWVLEESLDIEWAHAEAPGAKIVLVEAASASDSNLFGAVSYANGLGATEVSMTRSCPTPGRSTRPRPVTVGTAPDIPRLPRTSLPWGAPR
jgi:hypothetical protein